MHISVINLKIQTDTLSAILCAVIVHGCKINVFIYYLKKKLISRKLEFDTVWAFIVSVRYSTSLHVFKI